MPKFLRATHTIEARALKLKTRMFALVSTNLTQTAVPRGSAVGRRRVASTKTVVASAGPCSAVTQRVQRMATSGLLAATLVRKPKSEGHTQPTNGRTFSFRESLGERPAPINLILPA